MTPGTKSAALDLGATALLIAMLPSLLFFGHWTFRVDIPGTDLYVGMPGGATVGDESVPHDHASHCHGDAASCSDVPFTGASAFALMGESVACLGVAGMLVALGVWWWRPSRVSTVAPELRPPRGGLALFA